MITVIVSAIISALVSFAASGFICAKYSQFLIALRRRNLKK